MATHLVMMHDIENQIDILHRAVACKVLKFNEYGSPQVLEIVPTDRDLTPDILKPGDHVILGYFDEANFKEL